MMGMVFATVALFFRLFTFLDKRLTTVKHAFGVECRPGRSVFLYDCIKDRLVQIYPCMIKKSSSCIACNSMEYYSCTFVF